MPVRVRVGKGRPLVQYAHPAEIRRVRGLHRKAGFVAKEVALFFLDLIRSEKHLEQYPLKEPSELDKPRQ